MVRAVALGVRGAVSPEQTADLERIKLNQTRLLGLVNDLLNFARLERGEVPLELQSVPMHETLAGMQAVIDPQLNAKGIEYAYHACPQTMRVTAGRSRCSCRTPASASRPTSSRRSSTRSCRWTRGATASVVGAGMTFTFTLPRAG